jgi:2'-5' RNA ligase
VPARERLRTFLACAIETAAAADLYGALEPLRKELREPAFRWIDPRNYHVTLRFFGDLTRAEIERAARAVAPIAASAAPIDCRVGAVLALPNARRPSVVALALHSFESAERASIATPDRSPRGANEAPAASGALERLAARANAAFEPDFGGPDKPFKAHLTIARCRRGARIASEAAELGVALHFDRVALYESSQAPTGVRYAVLEEFALG